MKNRNIPFGYRMSGGEIIPHEQEAPAVRHIFSQYLLGATLQEIATGMTIPYSAVKLVWNKNQVKRVLDNRRYIGENSYPALVDRIDFDAVGRFKASKFLSRPLPSTDTIRRIRPLLYCGECGGRFRRQSRPYGERWVCLDWCGNTACLKAEELENRVIRAMEMLCDDPGLIRVPQEIGPPPLTVTRLQNEWSLEMGKLFQLAAEKYGALNDGSQRSLALRKAYAEHTPTGKFAAALFEYTVDKVFVRSGGAVALRLKNAQTLPE